MPRLIQVLKKHTSEIRSCDFFACYLASCSSDKTVRLWCQKDRVHFEEVSYSPFIGHKYGVNCVRFSPSGNELVSCSTDGTVIVWCVQNGVKIRILRHSDDSAVRVCATSASFTIASGGDTEKVLLWCPGTVTPFRILDGHESMITALDFTPDGRYLISCSSAGDIFLWDALFGHGRCLACLTDAHDLGTLCCEFRPAVKAVDNVSNVLEGCYMLATCGNDDLVKLWYVSTDRSYYKIDFHASLKGHCSTVFACRFSKDGLLLASSGADRIVILWNPDTHCKLQSFEYHSRFVTCCAFSESMLIASGSNDNTIAIVELDSGIFSDKQGEATTSYTTVIDTECQNVSIWTVENVLDWLKSVNLSHHCEAFRRHAINGKTLLYLTDEDLNISLNIGALGERCNILRSIQALKNPLWKHSVANFDDVAVLKEFICPITHDIMVDPVVASDGYSYESSAIKEWFASGNNTSPMTNEVLESTVLIPNRALLSLIKKYNA